MSEERGGEPVRVELTIAGIVQGVGFRYHVLRAASSLGIEGWVANQVDGTVRCVAEGPRDAIDALLAGVHVGPSGARVERVDVGWRAATGGLGPFRIRSGGHPGD